MWAIRNTGCKYLPAESDTGMFGGNSNWRGPVWMPVNALMIRGLLNLYSFYGDAFKVECPTGSGQYMTLFEVAREISRRLASTFLRDESARKRGPSTAGAQRFQKSNPHWRDLILFYEHFHGQTTAPGLGASHQTGWDGFDCPPIDGFGRSTPETWRLEMDTGHPDRLVEGASAWTSRRWTMKKRRQNSMKLISLLFATFLFVIDCQRHAQVRTRTAAPTAATILSRTDEAPLPATASPYDALPGSRARRDGHAVHRRTLMPWSYVVSFASA